MAVQAQSPSNVFLLNRNGEERKSMLGGDYYLQAQTNGFVDQSTMFFNNGGAPNNPRKRGRETSVPSVTPINLLPLQSVAPSQKLVNLSQLQNQVPRVVSTGLRLSLEDQKQQQMGLLISSSQGIAAQIQLQSDEIDQFIQSQGGQLRRMLAERTQRHYRALLCAAEESASRRLRQKLAEVEKAARRNAELEESAARLSEEARGWQARASAQEAAAAALQAQLRQAMMSGVGAAQDKWEELGCAVSGGENEMPVEDEGSAYVDPDRVVPAGPFCKECRKKPVSVVLLPCRHLCLCSECDSVVRICPICRSARSSSVEVFFK